MKEATVVATTEFDLSREKAEREAERLIESEWEGHGLPINPVYIAKQLGVEVYQMALQQDVDGILKFYEGGKTPVILVPQDAPDTRRRFSVAHELGHLIIYLRRNPGGYGPAPETDVFYRNPDSRTATKPEEVWANQFGAALLMPRQYVRALVGEGKSDLALASYFEVSLEAMSHRLDNLGLLTQATA
jgi:Zn-dependent peptidase ImmA (M78 family)